MADYASVTEVRNALNVNVQEFGDTAIGEMITRATNIIDLMTSRTWQGTQTASTRYYDGNGRIILNLGLCDLISITSLSIDDDSDGVYTTVNTSHLIIDSTAGNIILNSAQNPTIAVSKFTPGRNTVKISFTYGLTQATPDVKQLCIDMVANMLHLEPNRKDEIDQLIQVLTFDGFDSSAELPDVNTEFTT